MNTEHNVSERIAGHEVLLLAPPDPSDTVVICLTHDTLPAAACARFLEADARRLRMPVLVLEAPRTWWLHRVVPHFDATITPDQWVAEHVFNWVRERFQPAQVVLCGVGIGGQGALRISFRHPRRFPAVVAVQPWIDFHELYWEDETLQALFPDVENTRQLTATLWINPLNRPLYMRLVGHHADTRWFRGIERLHDKLVAIGVPHDWVVLDEGAPDLEQLATEHLGPGTAAAFLALHSQALRPTPPFTEELQQPNES